MLASAIWSKRLMGWAFGAVIVFIVAVVPIVYYRHSYAHGKRLREVSRGKLYRCGCLTAAGFRDAITRLGIKTIINLKDEAPDPDLRLHYFSLQTQKESEVCRELDVRFVMLPVDLVCRPQVPRKRPAAIEKFLEIMDDPANYPVLLHCQAGLHRTGCLVALYRMEYEGWSRTRALHELRRLGFGHFASTSANDYIVQYILAYEPGQRRNQDSAVRVQGSGGRGHGSGVRNQDARANDNDPAETSDRPPPEHDR